MHTHSLDPRFEVFYWKQPGILLQMHPANERRRYIMMSVHETVGHDQVAHKIGCLCISL